MTYEVHQLVNRDRIPANSFEQAQEFRLEMIRQGALPAYVRIVDATGHDVTPTPRPRGRPVNMDKDPRSINAGSLRLRPATMLWCNAVAETIGQSRSELISDLLDRFTARSVTCPNCGASIEPVCEEKP